MADNRVTVAIAAESSGLEGAFSRAKAAVEQFANGAREGMEGFAEQLEHGMESARNFGSSLESTSRVIQQALKAAVGEWGAIAAAIAGAGFASAEFAMKTAEAAEALENLHFRTGMSTEALQTWGAAFQSVGLSGDMIGSMVARLQMRLQQLSSEGPEGSRRLQGALKQLGLTMHDLENPEKALEQIATKLAAALDGQGNYAQVAGAAMQILGRQANQAMAGLIAFGRQHDELQEEIDKHGLTDYQVARNAEAAESVNALTRAWSELAHQIGDVLAPAFNAIVKAITGVLNTATTMFRVVNEGTSAFKGCAEIIIEAAEKLKVFEGISQRVSNVWTVIADTMGAALHTVGAAIANDPGLKAITGFVEAGKAKGTALTRQQKADTGDLNTGKGDFQQIERPGEIAKGIEEAARAAEARLDIDRAMNQQRLAYGQESTQQMIAVEIDLANRKYQIEHDAVEKEKAVQGQKPEAYRALDAKLIELESQHAAQIIGLQTKLTEDLIKDKQHEIDEKAKLSKLAVDLQVAQITAASRLNLITGPDAARAEAAAKLQGIQNEINATNEKLAVDQINQDQREKLEDQLAQLKASYQKQEVEGLASIQEANVRAAAVSERAWESMIEPFQKNIETVINGWLQGTEKMRQIWHKMLESMVASFFESGLSGLLMGGEKGSVSGGLFGIKGQGGGIAGMLGAALPLGQGATGGQAPGGMLSQGVDFVRKIFQDGTVLSSVSTAFSKAFKAIQAILGGGGGGVAGAVAGAAGSTANTAAITAQTVALNATLMTGFIGTTTLLETLNFAADAPKITQTLGMMGPLPFEATSIESFAAGGIATGGLAMLHAQEMVLPANISRTVQGMAANGGGGDTHTHIHIHAVDAKSFTDRIHEYKDHITDAVVDAHRGGHRGLNNMINRSHSR
jgi:hypothetical protein